MENNNINNENENLTAQTGDNTQPRPESIWAPGVPANISDQDKIGDAQLLDLAIKYVVDNVLISKGFMIEQGFPRRDFPNIVCRKDGKVYSIIIIPSVYPGFKAISDSMRLKFVSLCEKQNASACFAPVGFRSEDDARANASLVLKGDVFRITFPGFLILDNREKLDYRNITIDDYFRP